MKTLLKKPTYNLIVQSEDDGRNFIEAAIYGLFILSVVFGLYQFAAQISRPERTAQVETAALVAHS